MRSGTVEQYPSDLTHAQWESIRHLLPNAKPGGRPRTTKFRSVVNAIFYLTRTGCSWRYLPKNFPPWETVYWYFQDWNRAGIWKKIHDLLVCKVRRQMGRSTLPSCGIVDSQSVKAAYGNDRGYDGFKGIRGRKRQILVDSLGLIHSIKIHAANLHDSRAGHLVYENYPAKKRRCLKLIYADLGYRGDFMRETLNRFGFAPTLPVPNPNSGQGKSKTVQEKRENRKLRGLPKKRWVVERTFAWFNHYRRLSRDYERNTANSAAMLHISMSQLLLRRSSKASL